MQSFLAKGSFCENQLASGLSIKFAISIDNVNFNIDFGNIYSNYPLLAGNSQDISNNCIQIVIKLSSMIVLKKSPIFNKNYEMSKIIEIITRFFAKQVPSSRYTGI